MSYTPFDLERRPPPAHNPSPFKDEFQRDRENLISTSAFRRLQGKTQVFRPGTHLYRTRLTHSMEVASVGRAITVLLNERFQHVLGEFRISADLVEFACLAHDLGNPPVGHKGEEKLNQLMSEYGGFEGNAQTLRILTQLAWPEKMTPTRASFDSIIKYPRLYEPEQDPQDTKFLYTEQGEQLRQIREGCPLDNISQSLECQIMDLADDIVNACADFVDGVRSGLINPTSFAKWESEYYLPRSNDHPFDLQPLVTWLKTILEDRNQQSAFINRFTNRNLVYTDYGNDISQFDLIVADITAVSPRYQFKLERHSPNRTPYLEERIKLLKSIPRHLVVTHPSVRQKEKWAIFEMTHVFECLRYIYTTEDGDRLLNVVIPILGSPEFHEACSTARTGPEKMRHICDFVSSMTDPYLQQMYERLDDPKLGLCGVVAFEE